MARKVDITEKLSFDQNPRLVVRERELEVNADAATVLKIMGVLGDGVGTPKQVADMYDLLFTDEAKKEIENLKLKFSDFQILVENAIALITGSEDRNMGEDQTHITT